MRRFAALLRAVGCDCIEGDGSRVGFRFGDLRIDFHRPHPGNEAKPYQLRALKEFLTWIGITP
ncbi:MAG: type II toxin-antitoxin system HicA family toxin [Bacteroidetes bacterium]|nr:type II toxin-antitoxin system HicA family toxin [Bacteroidota bacterium]